MFLWNFTSEWDRICQMRAFFPYTESPDGISVFRFGEVHYSRLYRHWRISRFKSSANSYMFDQKNYQKITRSLKYIFTHVAIPHVILHSTNGTGVTKRANKHWRITHVISSVAHRPCPFSTGAPKRQQTDNVVNEIFGVPHDLWKAILCVTLWQQYVN